MNVDADTGELLEGIPDLSLLARQLYDAQQQLKAWEQHCNGLKAILLEKQVEKKVIYGDVSVSVRQAVRTVFDAVGWRGGLFYDELSKEALAAIIDAAKDFDINQLPTILEAARFVSHQPSKPYVVVELVRKDAPKEA